MRRRLFQCFQQCIETVLREHVHLVDQVHLVATTAGCVLHILQQLACVIDTGARRSIDLDQVNKTPLGNFPAGRAFAAGF